MKLNTPFVKVEYTVYDASGTRIVAGSVGHRVMALGEMVRRTNLHDDLLALAARVASLNENAGEIGEGMLRSLVTEARHLININEAR